MRTAKTTHSLLSKDHSAVAAAYEEQSLIQPLLCHLVAFNDRCIDKQAHIDAGTSTTSDNQSNNMLKKHLKMNFDDVGKLTEPAVKALLPHLSLSTSATTDFFKENSAQSKSAATADNAVKLQL